MKGTAFLLDTNVLVDYYCGLRIGHQPARTFIERALSVDAPLFYAIESIKDAHYLIAAFHKSRARDEGRILTQAEALAANITAWGCIEHLQEIATAVGADLSDVRLATKLRSIHSDFEDNLIIAAAERAQADYLVTNDKRLLVHSPVAALSTEDALALLESGASVHPCRA